MMKNFSLTVLLLIVFSLIFTSCESIKSGLSSFGFGSSASAEITDDMGPYDIIQRAQTFADEGNYDASEYMYYALLDTYGTDMEYRIIAEYEIAHLKVKDGKYTQAIPELEQIISYYEDDEYGMYPGKYLVLAQNDLKRARDKAGIDDDEDESWW